MRYRIIYAKAQPLTAWRNTLEEAQALAETLTAAGYSVNIWEDTGDAARRIRGGRT